MNSENDDDTSNEHNLAMPVDLVMLIFATVVATLSGVLIPLTTTSHAWSISKSFIHMRETVHGMTMGSIVMLITRPCGHYIKPWLWSPLGVTVAVLCCLFVIKVVEQTLNAMVIKPPELEDVDDGNHHDGSGESEDADDDNPDAVHIIIHGTHRHCWFPWRQQQPPLFDPTAGPWWRQSMTGETLRSLILAPLCVFIGLHPDLPFRLCFGGLMSGLWCYEGVFYGVSISESTLPTMATIGLGLVYFVIQPGCLCVGVVMRTTWSAAARTQWFTLSYMAVLSLMIYRMITEFSQIHRHHKHLINHRPWMTLLGVVLIPLGYALV
jgi:hypothetical protein